MRGRYKLAAQLLLALTTAAAMLALTSAVASASPTNVPMWKSGGATMEFGTSTEVSGESIAGLNLYFDPFGSAPVWITCGGLSSTGKAKNNAANVPGTLTSTTSSTEGPSGTFHDCQLVEFGEKDIYTGLQCTIPKELPTQSTVGTLTNQGNPAGGLEIKTTIKTFRVSCPGGIGSNYSFSMTGVGKELWEGNEYFGSETTKVEASLGGTGEASYGIAHKDAKGPVTIVERAYEEPLSTFGSHWFLGGAERTVGEGPKTLITQGSPVSLSGGFAALTLESTQSGVKTTIACSGGKTSGSVENPSGGGSGVGSVKLELTGCTVPKPEGKGCKVVGSAITTNSLPARMKAGSEKDPILELNQASSDEIAMFTVSGCSVGALNHVYTVKGQLFVKPQMRAGKSVGSWSVPPSLNESGTVTVFLQKATATGEITAESSGSVVTMG